MRYLFYEFHPDSALEYVQFLGYSCDSEVLANRETIQYSVYLWDLQLARAGREPFLTRIFCGQDVQN